MKNNSLWYLMSDFFYKHKCTNGYIFKKSLAILQNEKL